MILYNQIATRLLLWLHNTRLSDIEYKFYYSLIRTIALNKLILISK